MKTIKNYNTYIFISTFTRNLIDVYSVIYLYQKGLNLKTIIFIYTLVYLEGFFISNLSINIGSKIGYKYILIASSIITCIAFYIIQRSPNIYLISILLSLSIFTYHPIRHYYGMALLKNKKTIGNNLIITYIAKLSSSYIAIINLKLIYIIIIIMLSIFPALLIKKEIVHTAKTFSIIPKNKYKFFLFDQFKIIFLLLEPLYLYLMFDNISYIGIFNILLTISSIICIYILSTRIDIYKNYKYINSIFVIILFLKINIYNKYLLLLIAIFEGIGIKTNELVSTINLYDNIYDKKYIIISEKIFCITRVLILSIIYFLSSSFKSILYFLIVGIFILSFQYKKNTFT